MPGDDERRCYAREALELLIHVDGQLVLTRDVSATGIFFHSAELFDAGQVVSFSLPLPDLEDQGLELDCHGTIVRVEGRSGGCGVAVRIDQSSLRARARAALNH